MTGQLDPYIY